MIFTSGALSPMPFCEGGQMSNRWTFAQRGFPGRIGNPKGLMAVIRLWG